MAPQLDDYLDMSGVSQAKEKLRFEWIEDAALQDASVVSVAR